VTVWSEQLGELADLAVVLEAPTHHAQPVDGHVPCKLVPEMFPSTDASDVQRVPYMDGSCGR